VPPPVGGGNGQTHCGWCWDCALSQFNQGRYANQHCNWKWFCSHNNNNNNTNTNTTTGPPVTTTPQCNWRYLCIGFGSNCTCSWNWFCGNNNNNNTGSGTNGTNTGSSPGTNVTVIDTSDRKYCPTDRFLFLFGTGFESQQIFDYMLILVGEGCSGLHATTLVQVLSSTQLRVGPESFHGCTGIIYATLNYRNQTTIANVAIASLGDSCRIAGNATVTETYGLQTYCPTDQFLNLTGTGFESQEIFDYTLTLIGDGCTMLHATTLVQVVSPTELRVGPEILTGCNDVIYAILNYQNQGSLNPVAIASLGDSCGTPPVGGGGPGGSGGSGSSGNNGSSGLGLDFNLSGVEHLTFSVITFLALALSVVLAF